MSSKILNFWFIAGLPEISIEHYLMNKKEPTNDKENLKPEILISYPLNNQYLKEAHADVIYFNPSLFSQEV